jgi:hypothetical protein
MPGEVRILLVAWAGWVVLETANWNLPNLLVGWWGFKAHLLYGVLIFFVPIAYENVEELQKALIRLFPFLVVPVSSLAFAQLASPADSLINAQVRGGMRAWPFRRGWSGPHYGNILY